MRVSKLFKLLSATWYKADRGFSVAAAQASLATPSATAISSFPAKSLNVYDAAWQELVTNPGSWWDNRTSKANPKAPDYKHKKTGASLWLSDAPDFVPTELKLQGSAILSKKPSPSQRSVEIAAWQDLVNNPQGWYDNRLEKKNPKGPDYKHKKTGQVLWLSDAPDFVSAELKLEGSALPPNYTSPCKSKISAWRDLVDNPENWYDNRLDKKNPKGSDYKHRTKDQSLWLSDAPDFVPADLRLEGSALPLNYISPCKPKFDSAAWQDLVDNPQNWYDNRLDKKSPKSPDYKHRTKDQSLWLSDAPDFVPADLKLEGSALPPNYTSPCKPKVDVAAWQDLIDNPQDWYDNRLEKKNPKVPDYKHRATGQPLWLSDAPDLPLADLKLEGSALPPNYTSPCKPKVDVAAWKDLINNPTNWWDQRVKKNPKVPDYKHKATGQRLWLQDAPEFVPETLRLSQASA